MELAPIKLRRKKSLHKQNNGEFHVNMDFACDYRDRARPRRKIEPKSTRFLRKISFQRIHSGRLNMPFVPPDLNVPKAAHVHEQGNEQMSEHCTKRASSPVLALACSTELQEPTAVLKF